MISAEDIREKIMEIALSGKENKAVYLTHLARELSSDNWRHSMVQVQLVVDTLIKEGKIVSTQNGEAFEVLTTGKPIL